MATPPEPSLIWGLTWANLIAFGGVLVNLLWNYRNSRRDGKTRVNALRLDHFGHTVRAPLQEIILALNGHMDAADDIVLSVANLQGQLAAVTELKKSFHATRRKLARLLTDYDASTLVDGKGWAALEARDMDNATDALDRAAKCTASPDLRQPLLDFAVSINDLRTRLTGHLDNCAGDLMK